VPIRKAARTSPALSGNPSSMKKGPA
jgi:hypothetical protein